jgi:hypothetical protein
MIDAAALAGPQSDAQPLLAHRFSAKSAGETPIIWATLAKNQAQLALV